VTILGMILKGLGQHHGAISVMPGMVIATTGVLTIVGCIIQLRRRVSSQP